MSGAAEAEPQGWVTVDLTTTRGRTDRMVVPGGWLYRTMLWSSSDVGVAAAMTFVPNPIQRPAEVHLSADDMHTLSRRK